MRTLIFYCYLIRTSMKASMSKRWAFLLESGLMIINNLLFVTLWWVFFRQFQNIDGWTLRDMLALMSAGMGGYGLMQIVCGGTKSISRVIISGNLDPFMTQPKNILLHIMGSESYSKGWGHLLTSAILAGFGGFYTVSILPILILCILCTCLVYSSFAIVVHSLPFWFGSVEGLAKKYFDAFFLFALYPAHIYSGVLQIIMFTLIPAGIISYLPVDLIRDFTWTKLVLILGSSSLLVAIAFSIFYSGLKRYESGNKFSFR